MTRNSTVCENDPVFKPKNLIQKERTDSKLVKDEINCFLESNKDNQKLTQQLIDEIVNDPVLRCTTKYYDYEKKEEREITAKKINRLSLYMENDIKLMQKPEKGKDFIKSFQLDSNSKQITNQDLFIFDKRMSLLAMLDPQLNTRVGVHLGLFGNCIKGNGTDQQIRYWLQERGAIFLKQIYGCFAMTELGHGSNVANLQTTATYDLNNDSFEINTPNLPATKWWIGGAANSATHSVVYARLIVKGKDYGVKTFIVPLRDPSNFQLLPGIVIGDIGKKMGRDGIDNGWIQYKKVIIPREYLLSRFVKVLPTQDGKDVTVKIERQLDQISGYSALLSGRVNMVMDSFRFGSKFVTIATRYAVGRQQFTIIRDTEHVEDKEETQLIDYSLHQFRVLPQLAVAYLISPAAFKLMNTYYSTLNEFYAASAKSNKDEKALKIVSAKLKNLFISSASLKATNTWLVAQLIDELRQCCGGHGYSQYNGFGKAYNDWVVQCTWEGDNNILSLTSAKSILKKFVDSATKGKFNEELDMDEFEYLEPNFIREVFTGEIEATIDDDDMLSYLDIWSNILVQFLVYIGKTMQRVKDFDKITKLLVTVSKFHAIRYMLKSFYEKLNDENSVVKDELTKETLWNVYKLFSVYFIDKYSGEFQQFKILKANQISNLVQPKLNELLSIVRKDCIKLTDAFELPDSIINAPIGYYDGDIYHNYFNTVLENNPPESDGPGKPPYHATLTSMLGRDFEHEGRYKGSQDRDTLEKLSK